MTPDIVLPYNWKPRESQKPAMNAWIRDNTLINDWIWHRRMGKDDCALHGTCIKAHQRVGNYVHMLPMEKQIREAIWEAINPHTGKLRIDEAFPLSIREKTNDHMMRITLKNGSKWRCAGSDNYQSIIGAGLAGIVWSEWALSNPASYAYLSPMLKENGGWAVRQGTPRGQNHAYKTYMSGVKDPNRFAQLLTAKDTGIDQTLDMEEIKQEYIDIFGQDQGTAIFLQEWYCSFDAPIIGSIYGKEIAGVIQSNRFTDVPHNPDYPVYTAWDIGHTDAVAIWFFQIIRNRVHVIDYETASLQAPSYYFSLVEGREIQVNIKNDKIEVIRGELIKGLEHRQRYNYEIHKIPHDARAKTFSAMGKSFQDQAHAVWGWEKVEIVPSLSIQDGIKAARDMFKSVVIDSHRCADGFDALKEYVYKYDDKNRVMSVKPLHNWASNPADAWRYMAISYETTPIRKPKKPDPTPNDSDNGLVIAEYLTKRSKAEW
jgi:phage terminase large subunit